MDSLLKILEDGGCNEIACEECAFGGATPCELDEKITRKRGTAEHFSLAEINYTRKKLNTLERRQDK